MSWDLEQFAGKDVVFVGAGKGRSMLGVQSFLEKHSQLNSFTGVDKQAASEPLAFLHDYDPAVTVFIKNEGIPSDSMPVPYVTPLQLFFDLADQLGAIIVGITGTKGKSTTSSLTAHVLQAAGKSVILAGNIGTSPLTSLDDATSETIFVLELSSYQLTDLHTSPHLSACLNLFNDHADWHGSQQSYWEAKHNIMRFTKPDDLFVYNPNFSELVNWAAQAECRTIAVDPTSTLDLSRAQLYGDHNRLNALVARELCRELSVSDQQFAEGLASFVPLRHRMQLVATKKSVAYVDDAIGMTPESTLAGIKAITHKYGPIGCLLLGGQDRGYDFSELMHYIASQEISSLVLFPDTTEKMKAELPAGYQPLLFETRDMTEAVRFAANHASAGTVVLLSTAAPSYSVWKDFEDKGDQFQAAVDSL